MEGGWKSCQPWSAVGTRERLGPGEWEEESGSHLMGTVLSKKGKKVLGGGPSGFRYGHLCVGGGPGCSSGLGATLGDLGRGVPAPPEA